MMHGRVILNLKSRLGVLGFLDPPKWTEIPERFDRGCSWSEIVRLWFSLLLAVVTCGFCLPRFALKCEIPTKVASVAT